MHHIPRKKQKKNDKHAVGFTVLFFLALLSSALIGGRRSSPALVLIPTGKFLFPARQPERPSGEETVEHLNIFSRWGGKEEAQFQSISRSDVGLTLSDG